MQVISKKILRIEFLSLFLTLITPFFTSPSWAIQWDIPAQGIQQILLRAKSAKVLIKPAGGALIRVMIHGPKEMVWTQEVQMSEGVDSSKILMISGPEEGIVMGDSFVSIEIPKEISNTKIILEEVKAELQSVSQVQVSALKGQISGVNTGEGIRYYLQRGEIQSLQHKGQLEIESFGGKISIKEGQGNVKVQLFSGDLTIEKNQGRVQIESQSSVARIKEQQGVISLQWGKGLFTLQEFSGRLEGTSNDGQLQIQVKPDSIVDLQAGRGKVNVTLPSGSGASLNLKTVSGELAVPGSLKSSREGKFRIARGKLPGTLKGSVNVRAEEASITVK